MAKNSFLDYYKTVLEKVSFDSRLVAKEYGKAKELLQESERKELDDWVKRAGLATCLSHARPKEHQIKLRGKENPSISQTLATA
ncbi:hypothetical protein J0A67_05025 [Algoriphagus aestuariicola]|uniref:Uncharacterized protein n=1 Tax=Algoriphagus aestuariicola TaxID=1852016 RepID=A0ABS3BPM6_9BACT|nr:hypothetical protein [Algoriphagus aestuariicola]MBN7800211.1 hypothetical protein [Algoriphagus aestuariicola]